VLRLTDVALPTESVRGLTFDISIRVDCVVEAYRGETFETPLLPLVKFPSELIALLRPTSFCIVVIDTELLRSESPTLALPAGEIAPFDIIAAELAGSEDAFCLTSRLDCVDDNAEDCFDSGSILPSELSLNVVAGKLFDFSNVALRDKRLFPLPVVVPLTGVALVDGLAALKFPRVVALFTLPPAFDSAFCLDANVALPNVLVLPVLVNRVKALSFRESNVVDEVVVDCTSCVP
jgi:hypothetical protein